MTDPGDTTATANTTATAAAGGAAGFVELAIAGAWIFTPRQHIDGRGVFLEWFQGPEFEAAVGHPIALAQANCSVSHAGVLRGIHFADVPPGQAKYVTCVRGAVLDIIVDVRLGSPTFGHVETVRLDDVDRRAVYLSEGIGHGFLTLEDESTVMYLCSTGYNPAGERGVNPLSLGIDWSAHLPAEGGRAPVLSEKDAAAPSVEEAVELGILPRYDAVRAHLEGM